MIKFTNNFDIRQLNIINSIAVNCNVSVDVASIMFMRGIDTEEKAKRFLNPGKKGFIDPFKLSGVSLAVERIKQAKELKESVIIFGDYDADGICATTVLYKALKDFGIDAYTFIPEREDGYGLKEETLEELIEEYCPDLLITVDCGISGAKEVEYLLDLGVDVIITDHHEIPDVLPQCTAVINCKIPNQNYGFDGLCGTGVAWKLSTALIGDKANDYLDLVAIATIADSMTLTGENRDIVAEGLKRIAKGNCHPAVKKLLEVCNVKEITSTSIAFSIAPRINAAGRMGSARTALEMFLAEDKNAIPDIALKLNEYNYHRQIECEELYKTAKAKLAVKGNNEKIIILEDPSFKSGLVGIVAARLVEEFSRPVILFVHVGEGLIKGSARSIDGVNIFEAINANSSYLTDFGGHSQAAGVSLNIEDLADFERDLAEYIDKNYGYSSFVGVSDTLGELVSPMTVAFAKELQLLEPFGVGNKKPIFTIKTDTNNSYPIKYGSSHYNIKTQMVNLLYFNGEHNLNLLNSPIFKRISFEPSLTSYNGVETVKGIVREIIPILPEGDKAEIVSFRANLLNLKGKTADYKPCNSSQIQRLIDGFGKNSYETLFVVNDLNNLNKFTGLDDYTVELYSPQKKNLMNTIVFAFNGENVDGYKRIIYLDKPLNVLDVGDKEYYVNVEDEGLSIKGVNTTRETITKIFNLIKNGTFLIKESTEICDLEYADKKSFVFTVEVLLELGIIKPFNGYLHIDRTVRSDLNNSKIFTKLNES